MELIKTVPPPPAPPGPPSPPRSRSNVRPGLRLGLPEANDEVDLRETLAILWRGKWIVLISLVFSAIIGSLLTTQQPDLYRATTKVMFDAPRANIEAGEAVVGSTTAQAPLQDQIEVLRSTSLIQRVVDDLGLVHAPSFNPTLIAEPDSSWRDWIALPPEFEDLLVAAGLLRWPEPPLLPLDAARAAERINDLVVDNVLQGLSLEPIDNSRVIQISFLSFDPRVSAAVVNSIAEQYIVDQLEGKLQTFRSATTWLTERVSELQDRVETTESAVLAARASAAEEVGASLDVLQQTLRARTTARDLAMTEAVELKAQYERLNMALASPQEIGSLPEFRDAPKIQVLLQREDELFLEDDRLAATLLPNHPSRQRIADVVDDVRNNIRDEAGRILENLRLSLNVATARAAQLDQEIATLEAQELQLSTRSVEIRNLEREAQANRILYENLLARLQETNAQEDLQSADARILTQAKVPLRPITTARNRTMAVAVLAGIGTGIGLVFLLDKLNNSFRSPVQLEEMLGVPVLATVPRAGTRMQRADVIRTLRSKPNSSLAEAIRNLRTSILFSNVDAPPNVVMFSSSVPREGKSTTSMLTALTSRQMGRSAIIVDCDLRMPALGKVLQVSGDRPGLLSVIDESAAIDDAIYVEPETGLHVLMTQASERVAKINAADVLASERFSQLIEDLAQQYDLVVLDTPPTLVVTDARIVAGLADAVVFCVRWDSTPRAAVKEGLRELASVNAPLTGVAMTLVNEQRAARYAYDGYAYYKGRYRDYYEA